MTAQTRSIGWGASRSPLLRVPTIPGATQGTSNVRFAKSDGNIFSSNGSAINGSAIGLTISDWADLDGDGDLDFISDTGAIFVNNGKGTFTREDDAYVTAQPSQLWSPWDVNALGRPSVVLGDVNGDGRTDILFRNHLFLNDGAMRFSMDTRISALNQADFSPRILGSLSRAALFADVDNDGGALRVPTVIHERTASM